MRDVRCGFDDVRYNEKRRAYYCTMCGQIMRPDYRETIRLTLGEAVLDQLDKQCGMVGD